MPKLELLQAAFSTNFEANVHSFISAEQYEVIKEWIYSVRSLCLPISEGWIEEYRVAKRPSFRRGGRKTPVVSFDLPSGKDIDSAVKRCRAQQKKFKEIRLLNLIEKCAGGKINNAKFYEAMIDLWGNHETHFQVRGFEISGKHSDWKEVCSSISTILTKSSTLFAAAMANLVKKEINRLVKTENPNRGAWLSEMLCHLFPEKYPILNKLVKAWLKHNKYKNPGKASERSKFIGLSVKLRNALKSNTANRAKNLAELDHAKWQWYHNKFGGN